MNKLTIIGRLTRDPELRTTTTGLNVCSFTVAVSKKLTAAQRQNGQKEADYFGVTVWRNLGESCAKYLSKGKQVCVIGPVSVRTYQAKDGTTKATMEVTAEDVEFLTPKNENNEPQATVPTGYQQVDIEDELPF